MTDKEDLADYIADNYGLCGNPDGCVCHEKKRWFGRACPFWKPVAAKDWNGFMSGMLTARDIIRRASDEK